MNNIECTGCSCEIDPDVCHCGIAIEDHSGWDDHSPVPMGCQCYRDIPEWPETPLERAFAEEPQRTIINDALKRIGSTPNRGGE